MFGTRAQDLHDQSITAHILLSPQYFCWIWSQWPKFQTSREIWKGILVSEGSLQNLRTKEEITWAVQSLCSVNQDSRRSPSHKFGNIRSLQRSCGNVIPSRNAESQPSSTDLAITPVPVRLLMLFGRLLMVDALKEDSDGFYENPPSLWCPCLRSNRTFR